MSKRVICSSCNKGCSVLTIGFVVAEHKTVKCSCCQKENSIVTVLTDDVPKIEEHIKKLLLKAQGFQKDKILEVIVELRKVAYRSIPKGSLMQRKNALSELQELRELHKEVWDEL